MFELFVYYILLHFFLRPTKSAWTSHSDEDNDSDDEVQNVDNVSQRSVSDEAEGTQTHHPLFLLFASGMKCLFFFETKSNLS